MWPRTWRLQAVDRHPECQHKKEKMATLRRFLKFKSVKFEVGKRLCYLCLPPSKEEHNAQLNFFLLLHFIPSKKYILLDFFYLSTQ